MSATQITDYFFGKYEEEEDDDDFSEDEYEDNYDIENFEMNDENKNDGKQEIGNPLRRSLLLSKNPHECSICMTEFESEEMEEDVLLTIQQCKHKFCKECLINYLTFKISDVNCLYHEIVTISYENDLKLNVRETTMYGVPCPALKCTHIMDVKEISPLSNQAILERFHHLSKVHKENLQAIRIELAAREARRIQEEQREEANKPRCTGCRRSNFKAGRRGRIICQTCGRRYCGQCHQKHPTTMTCEKYASMAADRERERLRLAEVARLEELERAKKTNGFNNRVVDCPRCTYKICRSEGCNFMTCRCGQYFCYRCGSALTSSQSSSHFPQGSFHDVCLGKQDGAEVRAIRI